MDLMVFEGSVGEGDSVLDVNKIRYYVGDEIFIFVVVSIRDIYICGKIVKGIIGSVNFWNNELDCIVWFYEEMGISVEEMEIVVVV